jgi:Uma2 family endonuclease
MEAILEQLVRSPKLRLYVDELNETLRREQEARERFRESLDEDTRAEFINGEIFMHSPARNAHTTTVRYLSETIDLYVRVHGLGAIASEQALVALTRNDYGPDICFWNKEKSAGFDSETFFCPAPDFVCEVLSPTTEKNDRGVKFEDYAAHGVGEYWIVDPDERTIEIHLLEGSAYGPPSVLRTGIVQSWSSRVWNFQLQRHLNRGRIERRSARFGWLVLSLPPLVRAESPPLHSCEQS